MWVMFEAILFAVFESSYREFNERVVVESRTIIQHVPTDPQRSVSQTIQNRTIIIIEYI
jgi:hypothetical protein